MVGFRSKLGRRAVRIVDTTRSLSTQAGSLFIASALLSTLSLTLCVALIEVGQSSSAVAEQQDGFPPTTSTTSASPTTDDSQLSNPAATNSADEEQTDNVAQNAGERSVNTQRSYRGKVLNADGDPVAGATVSAVSREFLPDENRYRDVEPLASTVSAADGTYVLTYSIPTDGVYGSYYLMATLDGYAPDGVGIAKLRELHQQKNSQLDLRLARQKPIQGRIVDMEGNAVPQVNVEIVSVVLPTTEEAVEQWIANAKPDLLKGHDHYVMMSHDPRVTDTQFPGRSNLDGVVFNSGEIETDASGEFQLSGIGENCLVHVRLSGPTIAMRDALIVARDMTSLLAFNREVRNNDFTHYGSSPTIVVGSSQPITGVVVDADSGEPLKDLSVVLTRVGKSNWHTNKIVTTTDYSGHFQLSGAPLGGGHMLEVQPGLEQPYFNTQLELPVTSSSKPLECKFELQKTKWITGRIANESGDPLVAFLNYYPYRDNIHAENYSNFDQRISGRAPDNVVRSGPDGRFRIKAIPGPAVLGACVANSEDQPKYIPNRAEGLLERIGGEQMSKLFDSWSANYFDAMVEIDIDPTVDEVTQDLVFKYGSKRELRIVDAEGAPLRTVAVLGTTFPPRYDRDHKLEAAKLEVIGLQPNEERMLVLMSSDSSSGKMLTIRATDSSVTDVRLEQCATVTGQVIDQDAQPVANLQVHISPMQEPKPDNWSRDLGPVVTDAKGQFQLQLAPGGLYGLWAYTSMGPNFRVSIRPAASATYQFGNLSDGMELTEQDAAQFLQSSNP